MRLGTSAGKGSHGRDHGRAALVPWGCLEQHSGEMVGHKSRAVLCALTPRHPHIERPFVDLALLCCFPANLPT